MLNPLWRYMQMNLFSNVEQLRHKNKRLGKSKKNTRTRKYRERRAIRNRMAKESRRRNRGS